MKDNAMLGLVAVLWLSYFASRHVEGKILEGQLVTNKNWVFVARFCFLSEKGKFKYNFVIGGDPDEESKVNLLLYYDAPNQWPSVYPSNRSCEDKQSILSPDHGQVIPFFRNDFPGHMLGCKSTVDLQPGEKAHCESWREFKSSRPRWWFIVIADCATRSGLNVTYWMSLTNDDTDSFWRQHFSADEFYILPILIGIACVYVLLFAYSVYTAIQLKLRRLLHLSYKIFMCSIAFQLVGISCEIYSLTWLALTGIDVPRTSLFGALLECYSETLFTVLLLLLALGYTVTKSQITRKQFVWLFLFIFLSVLLQMSIFIYQAEVFDPGLVLYMYESPPGYGLLMLKIFAWLVFVSCCFKTSRKTSTKYGFYASLLSLGSAWFLCHPTTVLAITWLVDKWIRESVVKTCSLAIVLVGHSMFLYVTRPSSTNTRFPFHIRTCQVVPAIGNGQNHSYEPRSRSRGNASSLFTVSRATR